jgi:hypothetical protein
MLIIPATVGSIKQKDHGLGWPGQKTRPYLENNQSKRSWRRSSTSEHLHSKCKVLSSNFSTALLPPRKKTPKQNRKTVILLIPYNGD